MSFRNASEQKLIKLTKAIIPPLSPNFHKGQAGRLCVVGGCEDYTGAPFFSAHAAALLGCDLTHVVCETAAAPIIKSYSPDLMVHPYLMDKERYLQDPNHKDYSTEKYVEEKIMPKINSLLDRMQALVIGPGFGRNDKFMTETCLKVISEVKSRNIPLVIDADGLFILTSNLDILQGYSNTVITPNVVEFERLYKALCEKANKKIDTDSIVEKAKFVSKALGGITVLAKGKADYIVNGDDYIEVNAPGSPKRVGGQGDSLSGMIGTFLSWGMSAYKNKLWLEKGVNDDDFNYTDAEIIMLACFGGCIMTRSCGKKAYEEYGRSMQTSDLHKFVGKSYTELFE